MGRKTVAAGALLTFVNPIVGIAVVTAGLMDDEKGKEGPTPQGQQAAPAGQAPQGQAPQGKEAAEVKGAEDNKTKESVVAQVTESVVAEKTRESTEISAAGILAGVNDEPKKSSKAPMPESSAGLLFGVSETMSVKEQAGLAARAARDSGASQEHGNAKQAAMSVAKTEETKGAELQ